MKKHFMYFLAIMAALLIWTACDRIFELMIPTQQEETGEMEYVSFTNHGCQGWPGLDKAFETFPYLSGHRLTEDTLTLTISYVTQCCPAFRDSVSIHDATVDVFLADTSSLQCDCICEFVNDFVFLYPDTGELRVRFGWIGASFFELDTLIHIP